MIDLDEKSYKVEGHQTEKVEVCKSCGVMLGMTHHCWCVYYPRESIEYTATTDKYDYEAYY